MNRYLIGKPHGGWNHWSADWDCADPEDHWAYLAVREYMWYWTWRQRGSTSRSLPPEEPKGYPGYVYAFRTVTGWFKIGRTINPSNRFGQYTGPSRISEVFLLRKVRNVRVAEKKLKEFMIESGFKSADGEWYLPGAPLGTVHFNAFYSHWRDLPGNLGNVVKPGWVYSRQNLLDALAEATTSATLSRRTGQCKQENQKDQTRCLPATRRVAVPLTA